MVLNMCSTYICVYKDVPSDMLNLDFVLYCICFKNIAACFYELLTFFHKYENIVVYELLLCFVV